MVKFNKRRWRKRPKISYPINIIIPDKKQESFQAKVKLTLQPMNCMYCGAHERYLIETVCSLVCEQCACEQPNRQLFKVDHFNGSNQIVKTHRYVKKVYFLEIIRGIRGEKRATMSSAQMKSLKLLTRDITPEQWRLQRLRILPPILKKLKLTKYKPSIAWIGFIVSRAQYKPVMIRKNDLNWMTQMFEKVQTCYKSIVKEVAPNRKIFMNYNYLFCCLAVLLNRLDYMKDVQLPKDERSRSVQGRIWRAICCHYGWKWIPLTDYFDKYKLKKYVV